MDIPMSYPTLPALQTPRKNFEKSLEHQPTLCVNRGTTNEQHAMSSITYPIKCPKCGSRLMCSDNSRPGHYECDSFLMGNGVLIERIGCVERQRNQSLDALERALSYLEDLPFPEGHSACLNVREVLIRLRGSAL